MTRINLRGFASLLWAFEIICGGARRVLRRLTQTIGSKMIKGAFCFAVLAYCVVTVRCTTTTVMTVQSVNETTTVEYRPITECENGNIRLDDDKNKYQQLTQNENGTEVWLVRDCQTTDLIFSMFKCACVLPPQPRCPFRTFEGSRTRFQEILLPNTNFSCSVPNTFWNQTGCRCDWNPTGPQAPALPDVSSCHAIFNATFNNGQNDGVQVVPWSPLRVVRGDGADGGALETELQTNVISYKLAHTSFGAGFVIDFRFRSKIDLDVNEQFVALISNGCSKKETISISYRASDKIYDVQVVAFMLIPRAFNVVRFRCIDSSRSIDGFQWNRVMLAMTPTRIAFNVNDFPCHIEELVAARPIRPQCPLVIGGDMKKDNKRPGLRGFVDEISVRRYCLAG